MADAAPDLHLHLEGDAADHVSWSALDPSSDFDDAALERAIVEARGRTYAALADLDAA